MKRNLYYRINKADNGFILNYSWNEVAGGETTYEDCYVIFPDWSALNDYIKKNEIVD